MNTIQKHNMIYMKRTKLITGEDLTKMNIVVRDDKEKNESFIRLGYRMTSLLVSLQV